MGNIRARRMLMGLGGAITLAMLIDNWLPYALLSHHNRAVETYPTILADSGISADALQDIEFQSNTLSSSEAAVAQNEITIRGWFIPGHTSSLEQAPSTPQNTPQKTVIILHSLGGTRQDMLEFGLLFQPAGHNVVLMDLRSHGESEGEFFTYGFHEWLDVVGLLEWLEMNRPEAAEDITLIGVSVGGAVAIPTAAADDRIDRLVTVGTFADLEKTIAAQTKRLPGLWRRRAIAKAERLAQFQVGQASPQQGMQAVEVPVLVIHGVDDDYIPAENGRFLHDAANPPKFLHLIEGANHANLLTHNSDELRQTILEFINEQR